MAQSWHGGNAMNSMREMSSANNNNTNGSLSTEMKAAREIIKDRLYFMCMKRAMIPKTNGPHIFFNTDTTLCYEPFSHDFGPLNLANVYRFCQMVRERLQNPKNEGKVIYYWASPKPNHRANSAVLMGAYQVIYMGRSAEDAYKPLETLEPFLPFRDAAIGPCPFRLTVRHCLRALEKAMKYRFFDFSAFNLEEYEHFEQVENGDCNVILPGRFFALAGPLGAKSMDGSPSFTPDDYVPILKKFGVTTVIRLNKKVYDRRKFVDAGIQHYDLYFVDGTCPSLPILDRFINIAETHKGTIGVHCKAGLGRTGTCIAAYIMKHFRFTAAEAIAWLRICRPGSIIGPQQQFLRTQQPRLWKDGKKSRVALAEELKKRDAITSTNTSTSVIAASSTPSTPSPSSTPSISSSPTEPTTSESKSPMSDIVASHTAHGHGHTAAVTAVTMNDAQYQHHNNANGVHRVSSASSDHTLVVHHGHGHSHHNNGTHSMPSSPNIHNRTSVHTNMFGSLHGSNITASPPLVATPAFVSSVPSSSSSSSSSSLTPSSTMVERASLIGKRDDTSLSMRPIGGRATAINSSHGHGYSSTIGHNNTSINHGAITVPSSSSSSSMGMPMMGVSTMAGTGTGNEEKDRDVSQSSSRRSPPTSAMAAASVIGHSSYHDDHNKMRVQRPSDKLLQDNAKLKSGVPLSSADLKRANDGPVYGGHGGGARRVASSSSSSASSPIATVGSHTIANSNGNSNSSGNNHTNMSSGHSVITSATGAHGLAALRKKPLPTSGHMNPVTATLTATPTATAATVVSAPSTPLSSSSSPPIGTSNGARMRGSM